VSAHPERSSAHRFARDKQRCRLRRGDFSMPMQTCYIAEERRLNLSFSGNLDVSVSQDVCGICKSPPPNLESCIVDISRIDRLFDSGVALLKMLYRHLVNNDILVVILSDSPKIRKRMATITSQPSPVFYPKDLFPPL